MDVELALAELKQLSWDPKSESLSHLKICSTSLFHHAGIDNWTFQRPYLLAAFDMDQTVDMFQADGFWVRGRSEEPTIHYIFDSFRTNHSGTDHVEQVFCKILT